METAAEIEILANGTIRIRINGVLEFDRRVNYIRVLTHIDPIKPAPSGVMPKKKD